MHMHMYVHACNWIRYMSLADLAPEKHTITLQPEYQLWVKGGPNKYHHRHQKSSPAERLIKLTIFLVYVGAGAGPGGYRGIFGCVKCCMCVVRGRLGIQ